MNCFNILFYINLKPTETFNAESWSVLEFSHWHLLATSLIFYQNADSNSLILPIMWLGALLMVGFLVPLTAREDFEPTTVVIVALFYAFIVVPVVSGLFDPRPFQNYAIIFVM